MLWEQRLRVVAVVSVLLLCAGPSSLAEAASDAEISLDKARTAYAEQDYATAADLLEQASQTDARNPDVWLLLGKARYQQGDVSGAVAAWKTVLTLAPRQAFAKQMVTALTQGKETTDTTITFAESLLKEGLIGEALQAASRLDQEVTLERDQHIAVALVRLQAELALGKPNVALQTIARLTSRYPDQADASAVALWQQVARVAQDPADQAAAAKCEAALKNEAPASAVAAAKLYLALRDVAEKPANIGKIIEWRKVYVLEPWVSVADQRLVSTLETAIAAADSRLLRGADSDLAASDIAAIRALGAYCQTARGTPAATQLVQKFVEVLSQRYARVGAYDALMRAYAEFPRMTLSPHAVQLLDSAQARWDRQRAAEAAKISLAESLLREGLTADALHATERLERESNLSVKQQTAVATLRVEAELASGNAVQALQTIARFQNRYPKQAEEPTLAIWQAIARVAQDPTDQAAAAACEAAAKEEKPDAVRAAATLFLAQRDLKSAPWIVVRAITWRKQNSLEPWVTVADQQIDKALRAMLAATDSAEVDGARRTLTLTDSSALRNLTAYYPVIAGSASATGLVSHYLDVFSSRYAAQGAFAPLDTVSAEFVKMKLRPVDSRLVALTAVRWDEQRAAAELKKILPDATTAELRAWLKEHPAGSDLELAALQALLTSLLRDAANRPTPAPDVKLSADVAAAVNAVGGIIVTAKQPADSVKAVQQLVGSLDTLYAKHQAYAAAQDGLGRLLTLELEPASRQLCLTRSAEYRTTEALAELNRSCEAGVVSPGDLPDYLKTAVAAWQRLNKEFPLAGGIQQLASLAAQVRAAADKTEWPAVVTAPKPVLSWALEIAVPLVGSRDATVSAQARSVVEAVVAECASHSNGPGIGLASGVQATLLAATRTDAPARTATVTRYLQLLKDDAHAVFHRNVQQGEPAANAKLNQPAETSLKFLKNMVQQRPAAAGSAVDMLSNLLQPWQAAGFHDTVEQAFAALAADLPEPRQRLVQIQLARMWLADVQRRDALLASAGSRPAAELDPVARKALLVCYDVQRGLPRDTDVVSAALRLRQEIINHYRGLKLDAAVEAAILVASKPAIDAADAIAELDMVRRQLALAREQRARTLAEHNGAERLTRTAEDKAALTALQAFLTKRPAHPLTDTAVETWFRTANEYTQCKRYDLAVEVYREAEQFFLQLKPAERSHCRQPYPRRASRYGDRRNLARGGDGCVGKGPQRRRTDSADTREDQRRIRRRPGCVSADSRRLPGKPRRACGAERNSHRRVVLRRAERLGRGPRRVRQAGGT
jgi:tetratricopeptide (TPR) repeat protein